MWLSWLLISAAVAAAFAWINRFIRGDDSWMYIHGIPTWESHDTAPKYIPGRSLWYAAPLIGVLAGACTSDWKLGVLFALGYLIWGTPAWGKYFDLGTAPSRETGGVPWIDTILKGTPYPERTEDYIGFFLRQVYILPLALGLWGLGYDELWEVPFTVTTFMGVTLCCYSYAHCKWPDNPIWRAELLTGFFGWGFLIASPLSVILLT